MIKDFNSKFSVLAENFITRFQSGGILTGDIVKFRKDVLKNKYFAEKGENVKEAIRNAMETDLNLRVSAVKSTRVNSTGNYDGGFGHGTDSPDNLYLDIVVEYSPGLWRDPMTVPLEVVERVDTGVNMAPIPDSLKRDSESTKPEDVDVNDENRKTPTKDTKQKMQASVSDGRDQVKKPEEDKRDKSGVLKKESLEDLYDGILLSEAKIPIGTKVKTTMGIRKTGTIVKPFYWKDSTDGTYKEPGPGYYPVKWDDGTKGWHFKHHMEPI